MNSWIAKFTDSSVGLSAWRQTPKAWRHVRRRFDALGVAVRQNGFSCDDAESGGDGQTVADLVAEASVSGNGSCRIEPRDGCSFVVEHSCRRIGAHSAIGALHGGFDEGCVIGRVLEGTCNRRAELFFDITFSDGLPSFHGVNEGGLRLVA